MLLSHLVCIKTHLEGLQRIRRLCGRDCLFVCRAIARSGLALLGSDGLQRLKHSIVLAHLLFGGLQVLFSDYHRFYFALEQHCCWVSFVRNWCLIEVRRACLCSFRALPLNCLRFLYNGGMLVLDYSLCFSSSALLRSPWIPYGGLNDSLSRYPWNGDKRPDHSSFGARR